MKKNNNDKIIQENEKTGVIYCITNKINDKKYIGQALSYIIDHGKIKKHGLEGRFKDHIYEASRGGEKCPKFYSAIRKYGKDNFIKELLEICQREFLNERETFYILKNNSIKNGYNIVLSGIAPKIPDNKMSRINKIKETMKKRWKDEEYIKKTTKANLEAVIKRANEGKTRKTNKNLPANIYKTENGYDIRIMRNGKYKITSVTGKDLLDQEKLDRAIKKRDEILNNMKNNIDDSHIKKLDHNGNDLPKRICRMKTKSTDGYTITLRKFFDGKERKIQKSFISKFLTMDEKLDKVKKELIIMQNNIEKLLNK